MTIQTGITVNRKALANRISQELLGAPVTYAGVPSCAYRVGACITIDRAGNIEITNDDATKILMPFFIEQGWTSAEPTMEPTADFEAETQDETTASESMEAHDEVTAVEPTDTPAEAPAAEHMEISAEEANEPTEPTVNDEAAAEDLKAPTETHQVPEHTAGIDPTQISIPVELTVAQLTNLVHMLYSQQRLLNKAAMDGRLTIPQGLIARLTEYTPESPEAFAELLSDFIAMDELAGFEYDGGIVKMDFPFDLARVERRVEGAKLDGVRGALGGKGRVEVEQVVAGVVVVCVRVAAPVGCAVPDGGELVHGFGLFPVEGFKEGRVDRAAPAVAAVGRNAQGLCQKVFFGVDDVDQIPQGFRGVRPEADVDVDSAGVVDLRARCADGADDRLYRLDVLPAAHRADYLGAGVGDRAVALDRPVPPVGHGYLPIVQVPTDVPRGRAEVGGDGLGCAFAPQPGRFDLNAESLCFHGVSSLARRPCPARGSAGCLPPATHTSLRRAGIAR